MENIGTNRLEYIKHVKEYRIYRTFSPHSKCLLASVITKFDRNLRQSTKSDEFVARIFKDFSDEKLTLQLELEPINMLLVSSYTLKIPLTYRELSLILERTYAIIKNNANSIFTKELTISVIHSLGNFSKTFPKYYNLVRDSLPLQYVKENLSTYCSNARPRDISLLLYALEKLNLVDKNLAEIFITALRTLETLDNSSLATILYSSCKNSNMSSMFDILNDRVFENLEKFTTREICNISCAYLKADLWQDSFFPYLCYHLPSMKAQEVFNIVHLLVNMKVRVSSQFKDSYCSTLPRLCNYNLDILDCLALAQSIYNWMPLKGSLLIDVVSRMIDHHNYEPDHKFIYLLHYCKELRLADVVYKLLKVVDSKFNPKILGNREIVVLYSVLHVYDVPELNHKVESFILNQLPFGGFSNMDLQILTQITNTKITSYISQNLTYSQTKPTLIR